ncbi:hypothetical protein A4S05_02775 [Nostoc sp. KVJ20]|nr:hypothetical protein A4S05_02775 [Nostoc sp. KVJ20]
MTAIATQVLKDSYTNGTLEKLQTLWNKGYSLKCRTSSNGIGRRCQLQSEALRVACFSVGVGHLAMPAATSKTKAVIEGICKIRRILASSSTTKIVPFSPDKFLNAVPPQRELLTIHYLLIERQKHKTILKYSHDEEAIA